MSFLFPAVFQLFPVGNLSAEQGGIDMGNGDDKRRTTRDGRKIILAKMPTSTPAARGEEKHLRRKMYKPLWEWCLHLKEHPKISDFWGVSEVGTPLCITGQCLVTLMLLLLQFSLCFLHLFAFSCGFPFAPVSCCCHLFSPQVLRCSLPQKVVGKLLGPAGAEWALLA